jgi:ribosome-binding factor A
MSNRRLERLNSQMLREISEILRTQVRDPRVVDVTLTYVRVTSDLWLARVYVTLPTDADEKAEALAGLQSAAPFVRRALGAILQVRRIPELRFLEDETIAHARRIDAILREVRPPGVDGVWGGDEEE